MSEERKQEARTPYAYAASAAIGAPLPSTERLTLDALLRIEKMFASLLLLVDDKIKERAEAQAAQSKGKPKR
jgi:hypothetical protein